MKKKTTILLVDDDPLIIEPLQITLEQNGYTVLTAFSGEEGLELARLQTPDVVILDIMMPGMDGWEVCRRLRQYSTVPIIRLTALGEEVDRILGLELGAEDYLAKPFNPRELIARIRALLRRVEFESQAHAEPQSERLTVGSITLDLAERQASMAGKELSLRYKEFDLLAVLLNRAGHVVSRADLFDQVWGTVWLGDTRTLDVHIRWLREKIEPNPSNPIFIQTVRGIGYRFVAAKGA